MLSLLSDASSLRLAPHGIPARLGAKTPMIPITEEIRFLVSFSSATFHWSRFI